MTRPISFTSLSSSAGLTVDIVVCTGEDATVVAVADDLDACGAQPFAERIAAEIERTPPAVLADLRAVRFCSCHGLSALLAADRAARTAGVPFSIIAHQRAVLRPLRLVGLDKTLDIRSNIDSMPRPGSGVA
ncbi:STAS domain-containing protein [Amycolatopsis rubida]|uniref:STAS domain-containing protein n=1 Tax=Amycolatopsis rubida TaxID=112413 RepID=A0ABX0C171_9PSEU|nr:MULTISPECIES: STAS domain-containing protein [Amycolatopsis]MYW94218.1 STAS domain-containing protein [Amycolatopsis rubida]NEC59207.1 STAS domain-containing protein [Amycolatopsis rubida]OAP20847.1 Anti-sigma-F factor antagonist RsfB [Amycolatopsis sp. M39]